MMTWLEWQNKCFPDHTKRHPGEIRPCVFLDRETLKCSQYATCHDCAEQDMPMEAFDLMLEAAKVGLVGDDDG